MVAEQKSVVVANPYLIYSWFSFPCSAHTFPFLKQSRLTRLCWAGPLGSGGLRWGLMNTGCVLGMRPSGPSRLWIQKKLCWEWTWFGELKTSKRLYLPAFLSWNWSANVYCVCWGWVWSAGTAHGPLWMWSQVCWSSTVRVEPAERRTNPLATIIPSY